MSNFIEEYKKGQAGKHKGLDMGLDHINNHVNGLQQGQLIVIASMAKTGKSTFLNYSFVVSPYLDSIKNNIEVEWLYYSLEMKRTRQEFDFVTHFLFRDYGITKVGLEEGVTRDGKDWIPLSSKYLQGKLIDDNKEMIKVKPSVEKLMFEVYKNRIIPLFGEYNEYGERIKLGKIRFIEESNNPTGFYKDILKYAEVNGTIERNKYGKILSYTPNNPDKYVIVILDHIRKTLPETGYTDMKSRIDKVGEYQVILRNLLNYTFIDIIHLNRSLNDLERFKQFGDLIYPNSDQVKNSGNLAEDCDLMYTMFSPNDDRFNLSKHFGIQLKDSYGNRIHPNYKTIHLVEARDVEYPKHFSVNMYGNIKNFEMFKKE